jgi:hypothetical protein
MSDAGADLSSLVPADREDVDEVTLVDVIDRVIGRGVVISGDLLLGVAGVDLVHVGLRLVIRTVDEPTQGS